MEQTSPEKYARSTSELWQAAIWLLAPMVTLIVSGHVLVRWRAWDTLWKIDAIVFLSFLILLPLMALWRERVGKRKIERVEIVWCAYMCLMLAVMLFAVPHHAAIPCR